MQTKEQYTIPDIAPTAATLEVDGIVNVSTESDWTIIAIVSIIAIALMVLGYFKYVKGGKK